MVSKKKRKLREKRYIGNNFLNMIDIAEKCGLSDEDLKSPSKVCFTVMNKVFEPFIEGFKKGLNKNNN